MSDHDTAPDPMDKAYAQAEALLADERARAARRARVLDALAREPAAPAGVSRRPSAWARGRWLVAASVAGLAVLVATRITPTQIAPPAPTRQPLSAPPSAAPSAPAAEIAVAPAPGVRKRTERPAPSARSDTVAAEAKAQPLREEQPETVPPPPRAVLSAPPSAALAPAPAPSPVARSFAPVAPARVAAPGRLASPASPPRSANNTIEELVVTDERRALDVKPAPGSPADQAARLRAAALAGRTNEIAALLARGVPVDTPDEAGETALMKSIEAHQPASAALLRRYGANLDRRNRAGVSARELAASLGDAELDKALDLSR